MKYGLTLFSRNSTIDSIWKLNIVQEVRTTWLEFIIFSAGPSVLPESVLHTAAEEMLDYKGSGQSVMEMSHRSKTYDAIIKECEALLREVMGVPDNYKVLFLQGGASSQFAMVPLNLMNGSGKADFVLTGQWASKAQQEAAGTVRPCGRQLQG